MNRTPCAALLGALLSFACRVDEVLPDLPPGDPARGFAAARSLGCASCHAGSELRSETAPRLEAVGARLTPAALDAALAAGPRMPDCLAGLGERERKSARAELTHYLASLGGPLAPDSTRVDALTVERGRQLYHAIGCVACHAPFEHTDTLARPLWDFPEAFEPAPARARPAPAPRDPRDLTSIARRTTRTALAAYLQDPLAVHPAGRMPSLALNAGEAADLATYLFYEDAVDEGTVLKPGPGLLLDSYEADFSGDTADFDALVPVKTSVATSFFEGLVHREDDYGLRFRGLLTIETAGQYRFATTSDDGSMLYLDGALVVDNRGQHGMSEAQGEVHLAPGRHAFEVTYFEHLGGDGLEVHWSGPGFEKRALGFEGLSHLEVELGSTAEKSFVLDPELAARGRGRFDALGCAACHAQGAASTNPSSKSRSKSFDACDPGRGCLAREPRGAAPRYRLTPGERADLIAAVRAKTPPPSAPGERLAAELARLDCGACHARGTLTGPSDERRGFFQVARGLDLGDEGRLPPSLERVGAKLKPGWFETVLTNGGRVRPYMKTRMPQFGAANVAELPALFAAVDAASRDEREPAFSAEAVEAGKSLAGTKGLGCIQCHEFAGHPSIGIPAVDLAKVHERIYPGWFRELLMDPIALKMNTRMPLFWVGGKSPVKTVCGGDPAQQVDALWSYLALGSSMPLPFGLVPLSGEFEVEVYDTPVCVGVFMEGVSPRTLAVGLPERVHYAFDVQNSRLAKAWRGRFLDARGTWYARAGQLEKPAGEDVLEFPEGAAVAMLDAPEDPWPPEIGKAVGCRVLGRRLDEARRPVFEYSVCGVQVEESIEPIVRARGAALRRTLSVPLDDSLQNLFLRVAVSNSIEREGDDTWLVRGGKELRIHGLGKAGFVHRDEGGRMELRLPIDRESVTRTTNAGSAADKSFGVCEVEYSW